MAQGAAIENHAQPDLGSAREAMVLLRMIIIFLDIICRTINDTLYKRI
jgi:hypothetical protein